MPPRFENAAAPAARALARVPNPERFLIGGRIYGLTHFLLIAGIIYLALGVERVVVHLTGHPADTPLDWTSTVALFGGPILYLTGRSLVLHLTLRHTPPAALVAIGVTLVLIPAAQAMPAPAALALLTVVLVALTCYERITWRPAAAAR